MLMALDPAQRAQAVINAVAPNDMVTSNQLSVTPLSPVGVEASASHRPAARDPDEDHRQLYRYHGRRRRGRPHGEAEEGGAGQDHVRVGRRAEQGKTHYYRIQGPTFLIEYNNTQNNGNHIHSVWRDFNGDFGRDLLREHIASVPH